MEDYGMLYTWIGAGVMAVVVLSFLLSALTRDHYLKTFAINRGFFMVISISGIFIGSWMVTFSLPVLGWKYSNFSDFLNSSIYAAAILALTCIGIAWFFGRHSARSLSDMMSLRRKLNGY